MGGVEPLSVFPLLDVCCTARPVLLLFALAAVATAGAAAAEDELLPALAVVDVHAEIVADVRADDIIPPIFESTR